MSLDSYYDSKRWHKKREHILRKDDYIDRLEARYGRTKAATIVHHIYPRDEYPEYQWDDWNLISVSHTTHNSLHDRKTRKLTKKGLALKNRTKIGVDWRKKYGE